MDTNMYVKVAKYKAMFRNVFKIEIFVHDHDKSNQDQDLRVGGRYRKLGWAGAIFRPIFARR